MRYLAFLALPFALAAQTPEPNQPLTQALITEIQQLRLAIERSTLLGARTQLAISQLQLQETTIARLSQQVNEVRTQGVGVAGHRTRLLESIKDSEEARTSPRFADPQKREQLEVQIKDSKLELDQANAMEQQRAAREAELTMQLQAAQNQIADSRYRIVEMERALDAAIQQLLKQK